ncbi:hypothetical protein [Xanthomonas vesicatoria]|uniref:hypothetical protein n=1 Tax=Xanthomonas vesicatoria TaxID=56460 RepID=UPI001E4FDFA4|nr:hypothetical protein [Xanthomonas vesicatoria]MCC8630497.1 hypothetical protein [Xanthomonas vesicatoria]
MLSRLLGSPQAGVAATAEQADAGQGIASGCRAPDMPGVIAGARPGSVSTVTPSGALQQAVPLRRIV